MRLLLTISLLLSFFTAYTQTVAGLWRGRFTSNNAFLLTENYKYELLIFQEGDKLSGFSYSTLLDGNFYAVCEIKGTLFDGYMVITETKTLYENPPGDNNNFQTHILFLNADNKEATGDWKQANKRATQLVQEEGKTFLKREDHPSKSGLLKILEKKNDVMIAPSIPTPPQEQKIQQTNTDSVKLATRPINILQTININTDSVLIELYDDGLIDGDSVSVFSNNQILLSKIALSDKGLKQTVVLTAASDELILSLFAENQGTIPPNTGVLIIRAGDMRYEIRFTSDAKQSAAVRIKRQ